MKKIILAIITFSLSLPCLAQGFKIVGEIKNFSGNSVQLSIAKVHTQRAEPIEIPVKNGVFQYEGQATSPYHTTLIVNDSVRVSFMLYNEDVRIVADAKSARFFSVDGGPQCDQYNEYLTTIRPLDRQSGSRAAIEAFIKKYPQSGTSTYLYWTVYIGMPLNEAIALFDVMDKNVLADNSYYKFFAPTMIAKKNTAVGCKAPSMAQNTPDGEKISLDDFRGKYLLIDFWASWCVPCRAANPGMVALYNKFKDSDFTVLGISLDKGKDEWVEAIEKDGLTWHHISDLKFWDNEISKAFGVNSIPATVLIDPNGIIIGRDMRKEELEAILTEKLRGSDTFTLHGKITGYDDNTIYLQYGNMMDNITFMDSTVVNEGVFGFKGNIDQAYSATLSATRTPARNTPSVRFYIEPGELQLTVDWNSPSDYTLTGSPTNEALIAFQKTQNPLRRELAEVREKANAEGISAEDKATLNRLDKELVDKSIKEQVAFIEENSSLFAAAITLRTTNIDIMDVQRLYNSFDTKIKNSLDGKAIAKSIAIWEGVQPGKPAPEIARTDIKGNDFKLSNLKGKYIIVDFWASWCVPCRQGNPHMIALWNKYHDKGLEIVCIADNDSNPDNWRKAIEEDGIGMFYHLLRGLKQPRPGLFDRSEDLLEPYNVHVLPTKYLIGADSKIIDKMRDSELDVKLVEIFGF